MRLGIPQLVIIVCAFVDFGFLAAKHGEPKTYNLFESLGSWAILIFVLWWGGFFQ